MRAPKGGHEEWNGRACVFYAVSVADTVGSGDAFLAAIISKLIDKVSAEEALEFANALGAFVASCPGGCPEYETKNVIKLIENRK